MRLKLSSLWASLKAFPLNLVWRWPRAGVRAAWGGAKYAVSGTARGVRLSWREFRYRFAFFISLSRQFLSANGVFAFAIAFIVFGQLFIRSVPTGGRDLLDSSYFFVTVIMILFGMSLLPSERDRGTLEMLWSQPISRGGLALMQLLTLTIWSGIVLCCAFLYYARYQSANMNVGIVLLMSLTTGLCVGLLTVLVSTFCRSTIATGIVTLLIVGAHLFWMPELGPIALYYNPIPAVGDYRTPLSWFAIGFNRIFVIILMAFLFDYLVRRLRRTARWFT